MARVSLARPSPRAPWSRTLNWAEASARRPRDSSKGAASTPARHRNARRDSGIPALRRIAFAKAVPPDAASQTPANSGLRPGLYLRLAIDGAISAFCQVKWYALFDRTPDM